MLNAVAKHILDHQYKVEIDGLDKIDYSKPAIIMPNHVSLLDPVILALNLPKNVCFVANTHIAEKFKRFMKDRDVITVDPTKPYTIRDMIKKVKSGSPLVIFPEGRITTVNGIMKIYTGPGYVALKTGANIYPVAIDGAERSTMSYLKGKIQQFMFPKIKVTIGDPFQILPKENVPIRLQKARAAEVIQTELQNQLCKTRLKSKVNLYNELLEAAYLNGEDTIICEGPNPPQAKDTKNVQPPTTQMTYKRFIISTNVFSRKLGPLLSREQYIGVMLPTSVPNALTLFALFKLGKTPALLNFTLGKQSLVDCCETANLRVIISARSFIKEAKLDETVAELEKQYTFIYIDDLKKDISLWDKLYGMMQFEFSVPTSDSANEVILFTSGSESKPKGVVLTHDNIYANIQQVRSMKDFTSLDKMMNVLPMFHSFGLTVGTIFPLLTGIYVYLFPSPLRSKEIPEIVYDKGITILFGTSTFLYNYGRYAHHTDFRSLRIVCAGAEKLKDEVRQLWQEKHEKRIYEGYGTTEAAPIVAVNTILSHKKGSVGKFAPCIEYKIDKIPGIEQGGNLLIKGPNLMKGYLIHGQGFVPCGEYYNTGDVVEVDDEGYIFIKSRLKRFAKIGGEMIPWDLPESLAMKCFGTQECAVVSIPHDKKGERLVLFIVSNTAKPSMLKDYIKQKGYSPLLVPSVVHNVAKIPLLGTGKTDYVELKNMAIRFTLEKGNILE